MPEFLGVFRCYFDNFRDRMHASDQQYISAPCRFLSPILALSPLTSLALQIRRRRQRELIRCCEQCGHNLRATPNNALNAELLAAKKFMTNY